MNEDKRAAEERLTADRKHREEFAESLSDLEYERANPGDYECPSCKYITLKREASRCPSCRGTVEQGYWAEVRSREKEAQLKAQAAAKEAELRAKAAADEWKRTEPERVAAAAKIAAAHSAAASKLDAAERRVNFWRVFWKVYYLYLLPIICAETIGRLIGQRGGALFAAGWESIIIGLCPGLNWLGYLGLLLSSALNQSRSIMLVIGPLPITATVLPFAVVLFWALAGPFVYWILLWAGAGHLIPSKKAQFRRKFNSSPKLKYLLFPLGLGLIGWWILAHTTMYSKWWSGRTAASFASSSTKIQVAPSRWNWASGRLSLTGFGPIRIGMTLAEARSASLNSLIESPSGNQNCFYVRPTAAPEGVQFMVTQGRITRIDITTPAYASMKGARVGHTQQHVLELYSGQLVVTKHKYNENGNYLTFVPRDEKDQSYRMEFETDGKQITSFRAGKLPEVQYVDGCQ